MRYRIGATPAHPEITSTDHMLVLTAVLGLLIGVVLFVLARYGRQGWLAFWGGSLVLASLIYLAALYLGYY